MKSICKCGNLGVWTYGPGDEEEEIFYCDLCVPRGCSCNEYHFSDKEEDKPLLEQANDTLNEGSFYIIDYGRRPMVRGQEIRIIKDREVIEREFKNEENLLNFIIVPTDEGGREYPCCEYLYDDEGFDI